MTKAKTPKNLPSDVVKFSDLVKKAELDFPHLQGCSKAILSHIVETMVQGIESGKHIEIRGFGTFIQPEVKPEEQANAGNSQPQPLPEATKKQTKPPASRLKFRNSSKLLQALNADKNLGTSATQEEVAVGKPK